MPVMDGQGKVLTVKGDLDADVLVPVKGEQMVNDGEVRCRLVLTVRACPFVDDREIIEHPVGLLDHGLEMAQDVAGTVSRNPDRGDVVLRRLDSDDGVAEGSFQIIDDRGLHHK